MEILLKIYDQIYRLRYLCQEAGVENPILDMTLHPRLYSLIRQENGRLRSENPGSFITETGSFITEKEGAIFCCGIELKETNLTRIEELEYALRFTLNAAENLYQPNKPLRRGLDPTFYHTLTYEGDFKLIEATKEAKRILERKNPK